MRRRRVLWALATIVLVLILGEVGFRILAPRAGDVDLDRLARLRAFVCEGQSTLYEPRPHTVFVRNRNRAGTNSLGFRGEEWPTSKTPGSLRVILIGASTTESTDPVALAANLEQRTGRPFEVLNAGMSGWTTAESMVNWFLTVQDYAPDLIVLHHAVNDVPPRFRREHRSDYSHYRRPWTRPEVNALERTLIAWSDFYTWSVAQREAWTVQRMTAHPVLDSMTVGESPLPFPEGVATFRRNLATIGRHAQSIGSEVLLMTMAVRPNDEDDYEVLMRRGLLEHNETVRELATEQGWILHDFARNFFDVESSATWFTDLVHLNETGRAKRTEMLAESIVASWSVLR